MGSCLYSQSMADTPDWADVGLSVADGESSTGLASGSSLSVTQTEDELACGIELQSGGSIGSISGSIYLSGKSPSGVGYLTGSLDYGIIGLYNESTGDSQGFDVDWSSIKLRTQLTAGSATDTAYGVLLNEASTSIATSDGESIGGTIFATNSSTSAGQSIAIAATSWTSVGDIASSAYVLAYNAGTGNSTAISLQGSASIGDIAGTVVASADTGNATAISIDTKSSVGTISGEIQAIVENSDSTATGIQSSSAAALVFADGASITTQVGDFMSSTYGTAIENTTYGMNLISSSGTTTLTGNLNAGTQDITLSSGNFTVASDTWTSTGITLGSDSTSTQLTLTDSTTFTGTTLSFYVNSEGDYSTISIASGESLSFSEITTINIYISNSLAELDNFSLTLIDGSIIGLTNDVNINYVLESGSSSSNLTASVGSDGKNFVLSTSLDVVPEPCTTTLSILALSALCARRRRQV